MIRVEAPLETVPLFVRGGAILPLGPEMNYVGEKPGDPLSFEIYPDARGEASASLYEDDGLTEAYRKGSFRRTSLSYRHTPAGDRIDLSAPKGELSSRPTRVGVYRARPLSTVRRVWSTANARAAQQQPRISRTMARAIG